jgi:hypothetical protein
MTLDTYQEAARIRELEAEVARLREWKERRLAQQRRSHNANRKPEKRERTDATRARDNLNKAVSRGKVQKPSTCSECGNETPKRLLQGHHEDYSRYLDVEWLCPDCHGRRHWQDVHA